MAKVNVKPVVNPQNTIHLELTPEETASLLFILNNIGGSPTTTLRKYADSIRDALKTSIGLEDHGDEDIDSIGSVDTSMYFVVDESYSTFIEVVKRINNL